MKKTFTLLFFLLVQLTAWAQLNNGHFFKSLRSENLTEERAVERFNQWFVLPQGTEWRKVGERTDRLGMTRVEYRQYLNGVEVEHSQVLLHVKDGHVQTANGTVMEVPQMPAKVRRYARVYRDGTSSDVPSQKLYLVSTTDGYRYATKTLSTDRSEWIYSDADTGEVLKRIPTRYHLTADPVKVKGNSIYSGEVQMDASLDSESGAYLLWDQQRNIHTMIGAHIPSLEQMEAEHTLLANFPVLEPTLPAPEEEMTEEMWNDWFNYGSVDLMEIPMTNYIVRNATYASSTEAQFDSYILNTITIDRLAYTDGKGNLKDINLTGDGPLNLYIRIQYAGTDGVIELAMKDIWQFPYTLDLKKYFDEVPTEGVDILLYTYVGEETDEGKIVPEQLNLALLTLVPDGSGHQEWETERVKASATYEKGPWSAADIHWGMQHTYDFYQNVLGRNSYDDNGSPIYNLFYLPDYDTSEYYFLKTPTNNAVAIIYGTPQMVYGMGGRDGGLGAMYPVVELSVMAHEFTHMVTHATANLVYQGESGALNESFSDLLGISVKKYVNGNDAEWSIGEGMMEYGPDLRSIAFPKTSMGGLSPSPDTYKGEFWVDTESERDYGGVHTNSGVQNKWYYLLTDGDSGTNDHGYSYQVEGIGLEKSQQIAYRTLVEYATEESQYADIRLASIQAAKDLYGENAAEVVAVDEAWKAVGVGSDGEETAIRNIEQPNRTTDSKAYDLLGSKVQHPQKGLYIINGKKTIIY